jgi:hypothetical protein
MTEKRFALIIASYQYEDTDLRQLVAPAQDAEALARVLADPAIGGFEVQTLLNEPSYQVNPAIETFFADRKRDDLILLYFSGHGIKDEEGRLYLTTRDTRRKMLRTTAIPATLVNDVMRYSRSRRQVLLLDCCYSGAFARGMVVRADQVMGTGEYFKEARGQVVLTASDALQYSFEGDQIKGEGVRSVFTHTLVRGLETGEADLDGDGHISFEELYEYVYDRVTDEVPQQKPRKWVFDVQGEIIIARNPHPVVRPAELPPELHQSIEDLRPWVREGAARQLGRLLQSSDIGVALMAHTALTRMADDDSQQVRTVVTRILDAYAEPQRAVEAKREVEQLHAEKAKRILTEKPKPEPLAPGPAEPRVREKRADRVWSWQRLWLPLALVALLALVIGVVVIGRGGVRGEPTPTPTLPGNVVAVQPGPTPTVTTTPTPAATPKPPTEALQGPLVQIIGPGLSQATGFAIADTPYIVIRNIVWQEGDRVDFIVASDQTSTLRSATVEASDRELLIALLGPIDEPLTRGMQLVSANSLEVGAPVTLFSLHRERYVPGTVEALNAKVSIALPDGTITLSGVIITSKMGEARDSGTPLNDAVGRTVGVIVAGSTDASIAVTTDQLCEAFERYLLDACP